MTDNKHMDLSTLRNQSFIKLAKCEAQIMIYYHFFLPD